MIEGYDKWLSPYPQNLARSQKNWPVLSGGGLEGFIAPGVPIHGIVGVLEEVGALLGDEAIGSIRIA